MGGMMNAKRYTGCRCCVDPEDVARRQIEKREWRKEVEEEITWVEGPNGKIPYNITTESGKKLWTEMNLWHGSSVWGPVGRGIVDVEREVAERIIALLETLKEWESPIPVSESHIDRIIALIKGENE